MHLFYKLHRERQFAKPVIFHLDHSLRKESEADRSFIHKECQKRDLEFYSVKRPVAVLARRTRRGIEESGRLLRYRLLARLVHRLQPAYALTAHHADDYLESLLIHFIRGGGAASLASLSLWTQLDGISLLRPFVQISRQEITSWIEHYKLDFREDPSNRSMDFLRNRLRAELIPYLYREGLDPVKLWMNFHSRSSMEEEESGRTRRLKRESSLEYLYIDRRLLGRTLSSKALLDACLLRLGCSPARRSFLEELQGQMEREAKFRLSYSCKQFYLCSDRRGPIWLFKQGAAALVPFQARLLGYDKDRQKFEVRYNRIRRELVLAKNEKLLSFQAGMRVALGKKSKKLKKVFQETALPLPIRKNLPLVWNTDSAKVTRALLSFWEGKKDLYF